MQDSAWNFIFPFINWFHNIITQYIDINYGTKVLEMAENMKRNHLKSIFLSLDWSTLESLFP